MAYARAVGSVASRARDKGKHPLARGRYDLKPESGKGLGRARARRGPPGSGGGAEFSERVPARRQAPTLRKPRGEFLFHRTSCPSRNRKQLSALRETTNPGGLTGESCSRPGPDADLETRSSSAGPFPLAENRSLSRDFVPLRAYLRLNRLRPSGYDGHEGGVPFGHTTHRERDERPLSSSAGAGFRV